MTTVFNMPSQVLEPQDFEFLRRFLLERSAIVLGEDKHYLIASRLGPVARAYGMDTVVDVVHQIRATPDSDVATSVIEAMTTNETLWFRDVRPFRVLRQELLPAVLERNQVRRRLSVWSAASSTGQEIYSVALMLKHDFPQLNDWNVSLVGTDINGTVLEKARTGRFSTLEINRGLPAALTARYFRRDGSQYVIEDSVRKLVSFSQLNLAGQWPLLLPKFDIIFLRNVLMYFDSNTRERIIALVSKQLAPHGYLILGSAETMYSASTGLTSRSIAGTTVYQMGPA